MQEEEREQHVKGPSESSAEEYRENLDVLLTDIDWNGLDTKEKCVILQDALIQASLLWNVKHW